MGVDGMTAAKHVSRSHRKLKPSRSVNSRGFWESESMNFRLSGDRLVMVGEHRRKLGRLCPRGFVVLGPIDPSRRIRPTVAHGIIHLNGRVEVISGALSDADVEAIGA